MTTTRRGFFGTIAAVCGVPFVPANPASFAYFNEEAVLHYWKPEARWAPISHRPVLASFASTFPAPGATATA